MKSIATFVLIAVILTAVAAISTVTPAALAEKPSTTGLERADTNIHNNAPSTGNSDNNVDIRFHQGTCQGGHTTTALVDLGGCKILNPPGH